MIARRKTGLPAMIAASMLALVLAVSPLSANDSGFLSDYSRLKKEEDAMGVKRRIWVNPEFTNVNYQKIFIEQVTFYPEAKPTDEVSDQSLKEIRDYMDATLRKSFGAELPLADEPGRGVARVRMALTAVAVKKGLKPWELVPTAMIFAGAKEASGRRKHDVELFVESEITDSVSNETLALVVREAKGVQLKGKETLTLEVAKPQIDAWGEALRQEILRKLK